MDLDLVGPAHAAAVDLFGDCPWVTFTSGRRSLERQAAAMASNVSVNRRWIEQTYAPGAARQALQAWVDTHPQPMPTPTLAKGLCDVLRLCTTQQLVHLSKHLVGLAFDVQPLGVQQHPCPHLPAPVVCAACTAAWAQELEHGHAQDAWLQKRAARDGAKLLMVEGGLVKRHIEWPG